jgi:hypothetical protein
MAATAKIKFKQGVTIGTPGEALFGVAASEVEVANDNNTDVSNYTFELLDVPSGSALTTGVKQAGGASVYKFTPDVPGGYLFRLTVTDASGQSSVDIRCFGIKEASGKFMPPFGAKASALNFAGQARGWAKYIEEWLRSFESELSEWIIAAPTGASATAAKRERNYLKTFRTTNATPLDAISIPVPTKYGGKFVLLVQAIKDDGTVGANFWYGEDIRRGAANIGRIGAAVANVDLGTVKDAGAASWAAAMILDTGTQAVIVRLTGQAATNIEWVVRVQELRNAA